MAEETSVGKPIGAREWYDFIGIMADGLPFIHMGGKEATKKLIASLDIKADSYVLDVGSGGGNTACELARGFGCRVIGVDISKVMVAKARKRAKREGISEVVEFCYADVYDLPFEENAFDAVLMESVLTPLTGGKVTALKAIYRVLKPGGRICMNEGVIPDNTPNKVKHIMGQHPAINDPFTGKSLRAAFEQAGLRIRKLKVIKEEEFPTAATQLGCSGWITFFFKTYPKILWHLLTDKRIRAASKIDNQITKLNKEYMRYALVFAEK